MQELAKYRGTDTPIYVNNEDLAEMIRKFYPDMKVEVVSVPPNWKERR